VKGLLWGRVSRTETQAEADLAAVKRAMHERAKEAKAQLYADGLADGVVMALTMAKGEKAPDGGFPFPGEVSDEFRAWADKAIARARGKDTDHMTRVVIAVERAKREILSDLRRGVIPANTVTSFSELHDYVDANEYGGLCDDLDGSMSQDEWLAWGNDVQASVDKWLRAGGAL